jgi:hypothetical protein
MVGKKRHTLLFLMETKSMKHKIEAIRVKLGFARFFVVDPVGRSVVKIDRQHYSMETHGFLWSP